MMMTASTPTVPPVSVNGMGITISQINAEVQYHPAEKFSDAKEMAIRALVVRELLLQEAQSKGIFEDRCSIKDEQAVIDELLKREVKVPEPDKESCERYYKSNKQRFVTSPLFQVSHILFPSDAKQKALEVLLLLEENPDRFSDLAKEYSSCSSAKEGGRLGQLSKGQTTPEFEAALFKMQKGETSSELVTTRYGYHIIRVHERAERKEIPFDAVQEWIADYLKQNVWQRAVSQYIGVLAGKSEIKGFKLNAASSPLVQ
jgi:peptidyl-prolyl cis-trans isomerase C